MTPGILHESVVTKLEATALSRPNATALLWYGPDTQNAGSMTEFRITTLTYRKVWSIAKGMSRILRRVLRDTIVSASSTRMLTVGLLLDEGVLLPITQLAIWLASPRAAIVPMDPNDPRLHFVIDDVEPDLVITKDMATANRFRDAKNSCKKKEKHHTCGIDIEDLYTQALRECEQEEQIAKPLESYSSDNVSHIFFTSGSTGRPKGCLATHRALLSYTAGKNSSNRVNENSICFVASASTFDPSLGDFMATWCAGATLALAPRNVIFTSFGRCLFATGATHVLTTPSLFNTLRGRFGPEDLPDLEVVALGGEPMAQETVDVWAEKVTLLNMYGVTECCVYQTAAIIERGMSRRVLGNPIGENALLVMASESIENISQADPITMRPVSPDSEEIGEIWIAGLQVGIGYLKRPELTSLKYIQHPVHGNCFRTGDLARPLRGGGWELLGRMDSQVKISGQRVELGEIEETILQTATATLLKSVVAALHKSGKIVAWCVPNKFEQMEKTDGGTSPKADLLEILLRHLCGNRLPGHMVPSRFEFVDDLPQTSTGKLARASLTKRDLSIPSMKSGDEAETYGGWKAILENVWIDVLGLQTDRLSNGAHFMELGGDSLVALRVCRKISDLWDGRLDNKDNTSVQADSASVTKSDTFGELLGCLAPAELLKRPKLENFALHLLEAVGQFSENSSGSVQRLSNHDNMSKKEISDRKGEELRNFLRTAARIGSEDIVSFLVDQCHLDPDGKRIESSGNAIATPGQQRRRGKVPGIVPAPSTRRYLTPLHCACANGHLDVVRALLQRKAVTSIPDPNGIAPIHLAAQKGPVGVIDALLEAHASLVIKDDHQQTVIHHASRAGASGRLLDHLIEKWFADKQVKQTCAQSKVHPLDWTDVWKRSPLHWAVVNGHRTAVVKLLEKGADKKRQDSNGETPLEIAERRARCGANERPGGMVASVFADIATVLGGSGSTKRVSKYK